MTEPKPSRMDILQALAGKNATEILGMAGAKEPPPPQFWMATFTAFMLGAQWALELAQLDDELARQLIEDIHGKLEPDTAIEWNQNAMDFIRLAHEL